MTDAPATPPDPETQNGGSDPAESPEELGNGAAGEPSAHARAYVHGEATGPKGITDEQIIAALIARAGIVTHAAADLGIHRKSLEERIKGNSLLQLVRDERRKSLIDQIEGNYITSLLAKNARPKDLLTYLEMFAQDRGYKPPVTRIGNPDGSPLNADTFGQWFAGLTHEQQQAFRAVSGGPRVREMGGLGEAAPVAGPAGDREGDPDLGEAV